MEPGRFIIYFPAEPSDLFARLAATLAKHGPPKVTVAERDGSYVFEGDAPDMMGACPRRRGARRRVACLA